jgi:flagellar motility protein MotE (MotC chaperone)
MMINDLLNRLSNFIGNTVGLRKILLIKLTLLIFALLVVTKQLKVGDMPLFAEDTPAAEGAVSEQGSAKDDLIADNGDKAEGELRKSYLDGLLELPTVDRTNTKKREIGRFLDLAEQKERQVRGRLAILKKRENYLKELEKTIEQKVRDLESERVLFQQSIQQEKKLSGTRLESLVNYYKKMDAKKAAPVFEKMDKDLVVSLFLKFPEKQVRSILMTMNTEKSVEISEYFGRIRSGSEYEMLKEMNGFLVEKFEKCKGLPEQGVAH